jgi:hypothetical protein
MLGGKERDEIWPERFFQNETRLRSASALAPARNHERCAAASFSPRRGANELSARAKSFFTASCLLPLASYS